MPDAAATPLPPQDWHTRLSHAGRAGTHARGFVNPAVHRGSTVLCPDIASRAGSRDGLAFLPDHIVEHGRALSQCLWPVGGPVPLRRTFFVLGRDCSEPKGVALQRQTASEWTSSD